MSDHDGPPDAAGDDREWYSLREVASVLGLSRQAIHARVKKGQLAAEQVGGSWRVPGHAVAEAVRARRDKFVSLGAVRIPPVAGQGVDPQGASQQIADRVAVIETALAEMAEDQRRVLAEREREVAALRERSDRLATALHQMVDLLADEPRRSSAIE